MPSTRSETLKEQLSKVSTRGQKEKISCEKSNEVENSPLKVIYRYGYCSCLTRVTLWEVFWTVRSFKDRKSQNKHKIKFSFKSGMANKNYFRGHFRKWSARRQRKCQEMA